MARNAGIRVIVGGQLPPPPSGQHVAVAHALTALRDDGRCRVDHVSYRFAATMDDQGRPSLGKVLELVAAVGRILASLRRGRADVYLHPLSGVATVPVVKDAVLLLAARVVARRVAVQFHGGGHAEAFRDAVGVRRWLARIIGLADVGIVHAEQHRRDPISLGIPRSEVVPHRVPDRSDPTLRASDGRRRTLRVLYVGHLGSHRGTGELVRAVRRLSYDDELPVRLDLVGTPGLGWTRDELTRILEEGGGAVEHHGELVGDALDARFAAADVFAFPSIAPTESFGLVLAEALMWGLPVVATDWRANAEVLGGARSDVILHPPGPSLADEIHGSLREMCDRILTGQVTVPSASNRRFYERMYSEPTPLADVLVDMAWRS